MKVCKLIAIVISLMLSVILFCARANTSINHPSMEQVISLASVLAQLGKTYNCFFTIEDGWKASGTTQTLELEGKPVPFPSGKNLREALNELVRTVPNFSYQYDRKDSRIIHIINTPLGRAHV